MGKTRRDFALKPPVAVEANRTVFVRVDPEHSTDQDLLNAYGGVTAALKQAFELQPAAESRSFQAVIDGERTGQSQALISGSERTRGGVARDERSPPRVRPPVGPAARKRRAGRLAGRCSRSKRTEDGVPVAINLYE